MKERNLDSFLQLGLEIVHRCAEDYDRFQKGEETLWKPLQQWQLNQLQQALNWASQCKATEVKILSQMHKWPTHVIEEWAMKAEHKARMDAIIKGDGN